MGAENAEARFPINLEGNAAEFSAAAAAEMEELRARISGSTDAVKQMQAAYRSLRGSTDQVKQAKAELSAKLDAEKASISSANLALLSHGTTYEKVAAQAKELEKEKKRLDDELKSKVLTDARAQTEAMGNAVHLAGGPVDDLKSRFDSLDKVLGGAGGAMGAFTLVIAGTVAAIAAVTGVVVALTAALVKFIVGGADAARSANLVREAFTGTATNARNLGTQVDALAAKVPTSKSALNDLAAQLTRTRLSGQAIVDTFNLVGQASAAMGDQVGRQLQDIVTRGQITQRLRINPLELQGTGLQFNDIAASLATNLKMGVGQAKAALFEGRVKIDDGAKAIRDAVEKRFGEINARKMLSLDVQLEKLHEKFTALTSDVHLEPLLKGLDELASLFDQSTVSGAALKQLVTIIGNSIGPIFQAGLPIVKAYFKGLVIGALEVTIAFFKLKKQFTATFGDSKPDIDLVTVALKGAIAPLNAIAVALSKITAAMRLFQSLKQQVDAKGLGGAIADGVREGVESKGGAIAGAVSSLADRVKGAFADVLQIHSPSKVFASFGANTVEGFAGGVRSSARSATTAIGAVATEAASAGGALNEGFGLPRAALDYATPPTNPAAALGARAGGGGGHSIDLGGVHIVVQGGGESAAKQLSDPSFLAQLRKAIVEALVGAGVPTEAT